jgi:hypothetical protein
VLYIAVVVLSLLAVPVIAFWMQLYGAPDWVGTPAVGYVHEQSRSGTAAAADNRSIEADIALLKKHGWADPLGRQAMDSLAAAGWRARSALPLLAEYATEAGASREGEPIFGCMQAIARGSTIDDLDELLSVTAQVARQRWLAMRDPVAVADDMSLARAPFNEVRESWGAGALPRLRRVIEGRDDFLAAEAAAWIYSLRRPPSRSVPWLRAARQRLSSPWAQYEIDRALSVIGK